MEHGDEFAENDWLLTIIVSWKRFRVGGKRRECALLPSVLGENREPIVQFGCENLFYVIDIFHFCLGA